MDTGRARYGETPRARLLFGILLGLQAAALGGSAWAWARTAPCGSCASAADLAGGGSLAPLGVSVYGGLLALGVFFGRSKLHYAGILLAASVQAALLFRLAERGLFCGPCVLAGSAAVLAGALCLFLDPDNLARGSVILPIGATLAHLALFLLAAFPVPRELATSGAVSPSQAPAESPPPAPAASPGTAQLLVFTRPGCRYCEELEESVLPELLLEFPGRLSVLRRPAPAGLPSPTLVVSGAVRAVFPGLPPTSDLREAVVRALGNSWQGEP